MNGRRSNNGTAAGGTDVPGSAAGARARLIAWAEESDRASRARWNADAIAAGGAITALSVLAIVRTLASRRRSGTTRRRAAKTGERDIGRALAARAAEWLLPQADHAARTGVKGRGGK